jgi:hypothetical protein
LKAFGDVTEVAEGPSKLVWAATGVEATLGVDPGFTTQKGTRPSALLLLR